MTETERIIEGCRRGDRRCQHELYQQYSSMCYAVCCQYTNNLDDAQDLLIEGFVHVFQKIDNYSFKSSLGAWLRRLFVNLAIDRYRSAMRNPVSLPDNLPEPQSHPDIPMQIDVADAIQESLQLLSREEELVFRLVVVEEYTLQEVSEVLHASPSTIKHQYYRARDKVRAYLQQRLGPRYDLAAETILPSIAIQKTDENEY